MWHLPLRDTRADRYNAEEGTDKVRLYNGGITRAANLDEAGGTHPWRGEGAAVANTPASRGLDCLDGLPVLPLAECDAPLPVAAAHNGGKGH